MPAQSIYVLVTNNPPALKRIIAETNKRTKEGERVIDKKTFRGIALSLNGRYDNQLADEAFNFLREHAVLVKDEASGQFSFDPIKAVGLLAASERQDIDAAMHAAREHLSSKNSRSHGEEINPSPTSIPPPVSSQQTARSPDEPSQATGQDERSHPPTQRDISDLLREQLNDRLTRLEFGIQETKNLFDGLKTPTL